jgi:hydrogenase maturation protease
MADAGNILLIGYGNPGRLDDGLGPAFARAIEDLELPDVEVEADYQLTVENAAEVARFGAVVFADADTAGPEPFWVKAIQGGSSQVSFSSHSISPEGVLALARDLFHATPRAYLLGIRGYEFNEFGERLSDQAKENLHAAIEYWKTAYEKGFLESFREIRPEGRHAARAGEAEDNDEDKQCKTEST